MARSCAYRREISEACNWHQDQALNSTIYILYQTGPTGFLVKEEGESKNFKVFLGDVHNCTCPVFKKEKDLCKHICWLLLKKFRVPRNDSLSWQLGLNEREINQIIRGDLSQNQRSRATKTLEKQKTQQNGQQGSNEMEQRPITESDICPICQDELLVKKLPVTYCRFGCGNNVHIKCMRVWADHQKTNGETELKCPLCREKFCSFELLEQEYRNNGLFKMEKQDLHYGLCCHACKATPISGKCYKCTSCPEFYLCQSCFNTNVHRNHQFVFREKINQKYHKASRDFVGALPPAVVQNLATRDLTDQDYELLMQLDSRTTNAATSSESATATSSASSNYSQIPEKVIKSWALERVRENSQLLSPGNQCRVCLRAYQVGQMVRKLPGCKHKFHADCIDNWLLHSHPTCPIDGLVVWDPVTAQLEKEEQLSSKHSSSSSAKSSGDKSRHAAGEKANTIVQHFPTLDMIINYKKYVIENRVPKNEGVAGDLKVLGKKSVSSQRSSAASGKELAPLQRNATMLECCVNGQRPSNLNIFKIEDSLSNGQAYVAKNEPGARSQEEASGLSATAVNFANLPKKSTVNNISGKLKAIQARTKAVDEAMMVNKAPEPVSIPTRSTMRLKQLPTIEITGKKVSLNAEAESSSCAGFSGSQATTSAAAAAQEERQVRERLGNFDFESQLAPPINDVYNAAFFLDTQKPYQLWRAPSKAAIDLTKPATSQVHAEGQSLDASSPTSFMGAQGVSASRVDYLATKAAGLSLTQPCNSLAIDDSGLLNDIHFRYQDRNSS